jgi:crotonobetainyl-CoA:carnitine CoA-transferase CaiB-like acyl-CoA transferase
MTARIDSPTTHAAGEERPRTASVRYEGSALRPLTSSPALGQHTGEVLTELCGLDEAALADLRREGVI